MNLDQLIASAQEWAKQGVPVFPVSKRKTPLTENGHKDGSTDPEQIERMFREAGSSAYGIGAAMGEKSGMFAIDADTYKEGMAGESARNYIAKLKREGMLPETRVHQTMSGGTHYLLFSETAWPNMKPCPGVEVKGEGGYIVVPQTPGYSVVSEGLAYAPDALLTALARAKAEVSADSTDGIKQRILSGEEFHDALTQLAARLSAQGFPVERVQNELLNTLTASMARLPTHPRHARWLALSTDKGGEFTRIVNSGNAKFNPDAASERLRLAVGNAKLPEGAFFHPTVIEGPSAAPEAVETYEDGEWPFSDRDGYFGHETLDVTTQKYVMFPIIAENETTLISAEPKAGKTLLTETICMHIAAGTDLGGLLVSEPRPVIYFALESQEAIRKRLMAWKKVVDPDGTVLTQDKFPFFVYERPVNLMKEEARIALATKIAAADRYFQSKGFAPMGAIVFDTVTKAMAGGDQNSVEDTSSLFDIVERVREQGVVAARLFIHHDVQGGQRARGSSNIQAEPDTLLGLTKDKETGELLLKVRMARSIDDEQTHKFKIAGVSLGVSAQGYEVTAPVLCPASELEEPEVSQEARRMAAAARDAKILDVICALGAGTHKAASVHNKLKLELGEKNYAVFHKRATSGEVTAYMERVIPSTGRIVGSGFIVTMQTVRSATDKDKIMLASVTVKAQR